MTIFNKPLSDYIAFCRPFLILIPVVGLAKLALSLSGASNSTAWWVSMNAVMWIAILYYATHIHTTGFGGYRELLVICVLLNFSAQVISILGILIGIFTAKDNVYVFAFGEHERTWGHLAMHLFFGTTAGSLIAWLGGALVLAITRKVTGPSRRTSRLSA